MRAGARIAGARFPTNRSEELAWLAPPWGDPSLDDVPGDSRRPVLGQKDEYKHILQPPVGCFPFGLFRFLVPNSNLLCLVQFRKSR